MMLWGERQNWVTWWGLQGRVGWEAEPSSKSWPFPVVHLPQVLCALLLFFFFDWRMIFCHTSDPLYFRKRWCFSLFAKLWSVSGSSDSGSFSSPGLCLSPFYNHKHDTNTAHPIAVPPENLEPQFTHLGPWALLWGAPCASRMEASFIIENSVSQIPALLK